MRNYLKLFPPFIRLESVLFQMVSFYAHGHGNFLGSSAKEREKIFLVHLKPITLQADLNVEDVAKRMASLTPGFVGADIVTRLDLINLRHPS